MPSSPYRVRTIFDAHQSSELVTVHTWNYRRYLVHTIRSLSPDAVAARTLPLPPTSAASELAFTRKKIEENFSNYSAWHYRTKLLERLWAEKEWENGNGEREVMVAEGEWRLAWWAGYATGGGGGLTWPFAGRLQSSSLCELHCGRTRMTSRHGSIIDG